ncbi:hypothetical protein HK405_000845, partial [Cladochytrium tenue]
LSAIPGVLSFSSIRLWELSPDRSVGTLRIQAAAAADPDQLRIQAAAVLRDVLGVSDLTIQVERDVVKAY